MATTYELIATQTLASAAASITFSSIPNTYTDLRLVFTGSVASADNPILQLNGDTAADYSRTQMQGSGSAATSSRSSGVSNVILGYFASNTLPGMITIDLLSYTSGLYKTFLATSNADANGSGYINRVVGCWSGNAAVNSMTLANFSGTNWSVGGTATLYGIKAA